MSNFPGVGDAIPDIAMETTDGGSVRPSDFKGRKLVLFFYPKDDTPGCTTENKDFTALAGDFAKAGVALLGRQQGFARTPRQIRREIRPQGPARQRRGGQRPVRRARHLDREAELWTHLHGHGPFDLSGRGGRQDRARVEQGEGQGPRRGSAGGGQGDLIGRSVSAAIRAALLTSDPRAKAMAARAVARDWRLGRLASPFDTPMPDRPARPARPELLPPNRMPRRGRGGSERGRIALWHALAHIEFSAIDLALDAAGRFGEELGEQFTGDFLSVAADEAMHFALLERRLRALGSYYGALPAHDGLWDAAHETRHDAAARLAIVPMVLEARGLDVTPPAIERLRAAGDATGAKILKRILDDEIRHVRFGANHFTVLCRIRGESPAILWKSLVKRHFRGAVKPPFNDSARAAAGLSRDFYAGIVL